MIKQFIAWLLSLVRCFFPKKEDAKVLKFRVGQPNVKYEVTAVLDPEKPTLSIESLDLEEILTEVELSASQVPAEVSETPSEPLSSIEFVEDLKIEEPEKPSFFKSFSLGQGVIVSTIPTYNKMNYTTRMSSRILP